MLRAGAALIVIISNRANGRVTFPSDPIFAIFDSTGTEVYPVEHGFEAVHWEPGHSAAYSWPQGSAGGRATEGL